MSTPIDPEGRVEGTDSTTPLAEMEGARMRVLLVDDDDLFRNTLAANLVNEQFDLIAFGSGEAALRHLEGDRRFDVILLDWRMPGIAGIEMLRQVNARAGDVPIVVLTAFNSERNEAEALDCGALDFLDKSRSASVLARRLRIIAGSNRARVADPRPASAVQHGSLELRVKINRAAWKGQQVPLTATEFRIVHLLASRMGDDVSYREIYDVVHGRDFAAGDGADGYRTNVRSLIKRIRQKFRELDEQFEEIENYPGFGYRWRRPDEVTERRAEPPDVDSDDHSDPSKGQLVPRVIDAIARLPLVRSVVSRRRRPSKSEDSGSRSALADAASPVMFLHDGPAAAGARRTSGVTTAGMREEPMVSHALHSRDTA